MEIIKYIGPVLVIALLIYCLYRYKKMEDSALAVFEKKTRAKLDSMYKILKDELETYRFFTNSHKIYWIEVEKKEIEETIISLCNKEFGVGLYSVKNPQITPFSYKIDESRKFIYLIPNEAKFNFTNSKLIHHENHS